MLQAGGCSFFELLLPVLTRYLGRARMGMNLTYNGLVGVLKYISHIDGDPSISFIFW